ncbi:uncharacterized protein K460DRAFT_422042 [Cucurbitaria berberidis CBS 394.84]|uniref:Uncharacterized protein n=1 Tax=Cucurbitaria berberidis CBS 394.84 TaxID=1168544 RepID=A0A9P4LCK1_9PLEO|nr:uncharacterized protein K460DRAFT_422042 [Cucurbitaria berberidis CBS 394.84]KAF1849788.1 hypothetical protein K460DRAFT_422042 [Cucurbitaria berberidis CBS 394.84]
MRRNSYTCFAQFLLLKPNKNPPDPLTDADYDGHGPQAFIVADTRQINTPAAPGHRCGRHRSEESQRVPARFMRTGHPVMYVSVQIAMHARLVLKNVTLAADGIETCRRAMGGHGFGGSSGFWIGDNGVITQQVVAYLIKKITDKVANPDRPPIDPTDGFFQFYLHNRSHRVSQSAVKGNGDVDDQHILDVSNSTQQNSGLPRIPSQK